MQKKRIWYFCFILFFAQILFFSCKPRKQIDLSDRKRIAVTFFPIYDWTRTIINDGNNDKLLLYMIEKSGFDIHSFVPADGDISQIKNADLVIYCGNSTDQWISEIIKAPENQNQIVLNLADGVKESLGLQRLDEHFWLNPYYAAACCNLIAQAIIKIEPSKQQLYEESNKTYTDLLNKLNDEFAFTIEGLDNKAIIFADRFPFESWKQYGLKVDSIYENCPITATPSEQKQSALEKEQLEQRIEQLAVRLNEEDINDIYVTELSDKKNAKAIINKAKKASCNILVLDSLHSTTLNQAFYGKAYLSALQDNLKKLQ